MAVEEAVEASDVRGTVAVSVKAAEPLLRFLAVKTYEPLFEVEQIQ